MKSRKEEKKPEEVAIKELGWLEIYSRLKQLSDSKAIQVKIKNINKTWKPLIDDIKKMVDEVKAKHAELFLPPEQQVDASASPDAIQTFLAVAERMIKKADMMTDTIDLDVYYVANEEMARKMMVNNAVIVYKKLDGNYGARIVVQESPLLPNRNINGIVSIISKGSGNKCATFKKNDKHEILLTEESIGVVEDIIKEAAKKAEIPETLITKNIQQLLSGGISLADDFPAFLDALSNLPIVPTMTQKLGQYKNKGKGNKFNFEAMIKAVLPTERLTQLRKQAFAALAPEKFGLLSRDEQAIALSLMESYNEAMKFAVLAMDKFEIESGMVVDALSTKVKIVDGQSIKELCNEFNEVYKQAMETAKFTAQMELYPYDFSVLEQRKAMLEKIKEEKPEKPDPVLELKKKRIEERIDLLGEVKPLPKREGVIDFYAFMKKTLDENYKKLMQLKKQLLPEGAVEEEKTSVTQSAKAVVNTIEKELKGILDSGIYQAYFVQETKADENSPWVQHVANSLHQVKKAIEKVDLLQQQHPELLKITTPFSHLEHRVREVDEMLDAVEKMALSLNQLQSNVELRKLITGNKLDATVQVQTWKGQAEKARSDASAIIASIKESDEPLNALMIKVQKIINGKLESSSDISLKNPAALVKANSLMDTIIKLHKKISVDTEEKPHLLGFIVKHFSKIIGALNEIPDLLLIINQLSQKDMMKINKELNSALKDMVWLADKLEIQLCLREGYLSNQLAPMIASYYDAVNQMGYEFSAEDRYPFSKYILEQRMKLSESGSCPQIQKDLINLRIAKEQHKAKLSLVHDELKEEPAPNLQDDKDKLIKKQIDDIISGHITKLKSLKEDEETDKNTKKNIETKIALFTKLKEVVEELDQNKPISFDNMMKQFKAKHPTSAYLLYEGDNGRALKKLEHKMDYQNAMPADILKAIDVELAALKKQRGSTHYMYSMQKTQLLEERINACEQLRFLVQKYNLRDALGELSLAQKTLLERHDKDLLDKVKLIEEHIEVKHKTKTIIGAAKAAPAPKPVVVPTDSDEMKYAISLIQRRLDELKVENFVITSEGRRLQAILLKSLQSDLEKGDSLESAIHKIQAGNNAKHMHYLFEDRTGKMMKSVQNIMITQPEFIDRLDKSIADLKQRRYAHLRVFAARRKSTIDQDIEVLQGLKTSAQDKSVKQIIQNLTPTQKSLLRQYEPDLSNDFKKLLEAKPAAAPKLGNR